MLNHSLPLKQSRSLLGRNPLAVLDVLTDELLFCRALG